MAGKAKITLPGGKTLTIRAVDGAPGRDADEAAIVDKLRESLPKAGDVAALVPKPKDGQDGAPGRDGKDGARGLKGLRGLRGLQGRPGKDGKDGRDGSPDTPGEIAEKLNTLVGAVDASVIRGYSGRGAIHRGGQTTFLGLTDTPDSYSGAAGQAVYVNGSGTGLTFQAAVSSDEKAKVSANDTTGGYLNGKLVAGSNITFTENNDGGNETLTISGSAGYTDEQAQDAVGGILSAEFTYNDAAPSIGIASVAATKVNGLTPGSVPFASSAGALSQDNQNLYFDDTNDRLSIFSSLGTEVLANPNFTGSATGWTLASGWAYSANAVSHTANGTGALSQTVTIQAYREYLLTYTVSGLTSGTVNVTLTMGTGSYTGPTRSANGTYSERIHLSFPATALNFVPSNTARLTVDTVSLKPLLGTNTKSSLAVGGLSVEGNWSNGQPGTTRAQTFSNDGSYTWTDYRFAGTLRAAFGANSSGGVDAYFSGGNGFAFYSGNSGLTSTSLAAYLTSTAFAHYGYGEFLNGVHAGSISANTSTLQTAGGTALKVKRVTANATLDNTATHWLVDATNAASCSGTPSVTACSTYTASGQATCESHLPCVWFAGSSCSVFNNESGMGSCAGQTGCTVETADCSGATDQTSCEALDDSYGGACTWNAEVTGDCSAFNGQESTCGSTTGCSVNSSNTCASQGDESSCTGAGCSWNGSSCDGDNSTCTGTYVVTPSSCTGTYYTGNCNGTYGASCSGTVTCASYGSSGACSAEAGCTWSTTLNLALPDGETCPDRTYWIKNDSSGGADVNLVPHSGQTVEKASSYLLPTYQQAVHLAYFKQTYDCANYVTEGACTPTGCTKNYASCSWDSMSSTCSGHASCTGIGDQPTCESTSYFSWCSGTEVVAKNWYIF